MSEFSGAKLIPTGAENYQVSYGDDSGLFVEFYLNEIQDMKATEKEGRPIFKSREYIRIIPYGSKLTKVDRAVRFTAQGNMPSDVDRFPRQWKQFQNQSATPIEGTPLEEWPAITRTDALNLKAMGIHTVETLAGLQDNNLTWLGARQMREKAKATLAKAQDGSVVLKQAKEIEELKQQIQAMQDQFNGLAPAKKRGRPKGVNDAQNPS